MLIYLIMLAQLNQPPTNLDRAIDHFQDIKQERNEERRHREVVNELRENNRRENFEFWWDATKPDRDYND